MNELKVSLFKNAHNTDPYGEFELREVIENIRTGVFADQIEEVRRLKREGNEEEVKRKKCALPAFTACGVFVGGRKGTFIQTYSGLLPFDIDHVGYERAVAIRDSLKSIPEVPFAFISPSGDGVKFGIQVSSGLENHPWAYEFATHWIGKRIGEDVTIDPRNKDVSRLTFLSSDPGAFLREEPLTPLSIPPQPERSFHRRAGAPVDWPSEEHKRIATDVLGRGTFEWLPEPQDKTPGTPLCFIECPGKAKHTSGDGERDCCLMIGQTDPIVASCFHASCRDEIRELNLRLATQNRNVCFLPGIGRPYGEWAADIGRHLAPRAYWFNRCGLVVATEEARQEDHMWNDPNVTANLITIDPSQSVTHLERVLVHASPSKKSRGAITSMTPNQACILLKSPQLLEELPKLRSVECVITPFRTDTGILYPKRGYNPGLCAWISHRAPEPQEMGIEEAKKVLWEEVWDDFPFKDEIVNDTPKDKSIDRAHAVAFLLTSFGRNLLRPATSTVPLFIIQANAPRAGKDAMANIVQLTSTGRFSELGLPAGNEEFDKLILGVMVKGARHLHFGNVRGDIDLTSLERFLTSENFTGRRLGVNTVIEIPRTCLVSMSANQGFSVTPDLQARSLVINLHVTEADPNRRSFHRPNLIEEVKKMRPRILGALGAVVDFWVLQGAPDGRIPFASAGEWQRSIGGIMRSVWGIEPQVDSSGLQLRVDPIEESWSQLCEIMLREHNDRPKTSKEVRAIIESHNSDSETEEPIFLEWMDPKCPSIMSGYGRQALGSFLNQRANRRCRGGGMKIRNPHAEAPRRQFIWLRELDQMESD